MRAGLGSDEAAIAFRSPVDVVVVGGGLAGLTAAATAARAGCSVVLLDGHPGGNRAATERVGRFLLNRGAHALYRKGAGRSVLARLGVRVSGTRPPLFGGKGRRNDAVEPLPLGPVSTVRSRLVSARGLARLGRVLAGMPRWRPEALADRTAAEWFDELGLVGDERGIVEMLARTTTYVRDLDVVSADLVAAQVRSAAVGNVEYLDGGWQTMLHGLRDAGDRAGVERRAATARAVVPEGRLVRVDVALGVGASETGSSGSGSGQNGSDGSGSDGAADAAVGTPLLARAVVLASGSPDAMARVLPERPPSWSALTGPVTASCLDLGLAEPPPTRTLLGVDRPLYLICHSPPASLAPKGGAVVHAMRYLGLGEHPSAAEARSDLEAHARLAGIDPGAAEVARYRHRMVCFGALPTPEGGGMAGRPSVTSAGFEGVFVAGDWLGPRGHLADATLATGEEAGRLAADRVAASGAPASLHVGAAGA